MRRLEVCCHNPMNSQKLGQRHGRDSSLAPSERAEPCWHLDFGLLGSRTVRRYVSAVQTTQFVDICYGTPGKLLQPSKTLHLLLTQYKGSSTPPASCLWKVMFSQPLPNKSQKHGSRIHDGKYVNMEWQKNSSWTRRTDKNLNSKSAIWWSQKC